MIYTELTNITRYRGLGTYMDEALEYLASHPLEDFPVGHYEIDGDFVYMNVFEYETVPDEDAFFEAHKKYADIHMIVSGEELTGVSDLSRIEVMTFDEEKDLLEIQGMVEHYIRLTPGKALIVMPEDAHKVKVASGAPTAVKKAVAKVYVGE